MSCHYCGGKGFFTLADGRCPCPCCQTALYHATPVGGHTAPPEQEKRDSGQRRAIPGAVYSRLYRAKKSANRSRARVAAMRVKMRKIIAAAEHYGLDLEADLRRNE